MLVSTTIATEDESHKCIKFADFSVYKAWQFSMSNVRRDFILKTKTLISTHWNKKCETCPFRATFMILASPNGLCPQY